MLSISQIKDRLNLSEQFIHIWLTAGGLHSCPKTHPYVFTRVSFQRSTLDKDMNAEEVRETLVLQCRTCRCSRCERTKVPLQLQSASPSVVSCSAELQHTRLTERHLIVALLPLHGIGVLNAQSHTHNRTESLSACFDAWNMHLQKTNHSLLFFLLSSFNKFRVQQLN